MYKGSSASTPQIGHSLFDLSHNRKFNADMQLLYPVLAEECIPGDRFKIGNGIVIRLNPMFAPILHEINVFTHYFFVPYRLLWPKNDSRDDRATDGWEVFYTGGVDGTLEPEIPYMLFDSPSKGALEDYFGMPVGDNLSYAVNAFPFAAYQFIYNEYYRDPNLQTSTMYELHAGLNAHGGDWATTIQTSLRHRCWEKDYFTAALPWQQRGDAPALPVQGIVNADGLVDLTNNSSAGGMVLYGSGTSPNNPPSQLPQWAPIGTGGGTDPTAANLNMKNWLEQLTVTGSSVDISDLRLAIQMQKWMERSARSGPRYIEALRAHYGAYPNDSRLQRPEYIGGTKYPVVISEVVQTGATDDVSPQGNLAGHGVVSNGNRVASYRVQEHGIIMGLMSIMAKPAYSQGIDRMWMRKTKWDYYSPEFAHLSEQPIYQGEIYAQSGNFSDTDQNFRVWGYQGRYDELRIRRDMVCGDLRDTLDYWHLGRQFAALPELNDAFIKDPPRKDIFADPSQPGFIVNFFNKIHAYRPMPAISNPGLMDHF